MSVVETTMSAMTIRAVTMVVIMMKSDDCGD
jgi:hypothetical protein